MAGFLTAFLLSLRVNINEFSMHHFYKNRLVRCYLGASAKKRRPDLLTGFDPKDDFKIAALRAKAAPQQPAGKATTTPQDSAPQETAPPPLGYNGPYPIVNCALNLNTGSELATAERKAASFVFTPRVCGFEPAHSELDKQLYERPCGDLSAHGYCDTDGFMMPEGPALGTAMAISGAAVNPNAGYHTSTPLAFLLTVFNVRLGWWVGNPRRARKRARPGPRVALWSLLAELFAQSDSRSAYLNLSDGGHFENLGLYELVRRRCRYIIVGDAEEDPQYTFGALGGAIRKCRADFGVEITINPDSLRPATDKPFSGGHCVVGTIRYPEPDVSQMPKEMCEEAEPADPDFMQGWLVYFTNRRTSSSIRPATEHVPTSRPATSSSASRSLRATEGWASTWSRPRSSASRSISTAPQRTTASWICFRICTVNGIQSAAKIRLATTLNDTTA
jgi:hypothetical protein